MSYDVSIFSEEDQPESKETDHEKEKKKNK